MAYVSKKRTFGIATDDVWRYRTVNNIKILPNFNDVPKFISGICRRWKIEKYREGNKFIQNFSESIQDWRETHLNGFDYENDNGDLSYFLLLTKPHQDGRSTEVIFTHHTLSKSLRYSSDSTEVSVEGSNALMWLKQRACNELHLPNQTTQKLMDKTTNYPAIDESTCSIYTGDFEKTLTTHEMKLIIQKSTPAASYQGWQYFLMNKEKHDKSILECIPVIAEYSQYCDSAEQFFEDLIKKIQDLKTLHQVSYPFLHRKKLCALVIVMQSIHENVIEVACRFQTVVE